ncbi:MAG: trypsin-like serine peptidase [Bdellovibrionota bacterium]
MNYALNLILLAALFSSGFAIGKTTDEDCVECNVKKHGQDSAFSKNTASLLDKISEIPAELPPNKKVAVYGGHKIEVMTPGYPWNSIGRLFLTNGGVTFCTATRISACHVLTNAHCVRDATGEYEPGIAYLPPFEKKVNVVEKGDVLAGKGDFSKTCSPDWAVMRLPDSKAGEKDGWLGIKDRKGTELTGKTFTYAGFDSEQSPRAKEAYIDRKAEVIRTDKGTFYGDPNFIFIRVNSAPGGSGGPLLEFDESGKAWITGMACSGAVDENNKTFFLNGDETSLLAQGVASNAFLPQVKKFMEENPCKP